MSYDSWKTTEPADLYEDKPVDAADDLPDDDDDVPGPYDIEDLSEPNPWADDADD